MADAIGHYSGVRVSGAEVRERGAMSEQRDQPADLVFVNGRVLTIDARSSVADAVAVRGSKIVAVGDRDMIEAMTGPATQVIDLHGGTLLPGINDSHIHAVSLGALTPPLSIDVGYPAASSIADVARLIEQAANERPPGEWVRGGGWDLGYLEECTADPDRLPTRHDIDAASPDHPVLLHDFSLHSGWVNTSALRLAGIDPDGDYGDDDMIVTDTDGRPTGLLYESAVRTVLENVPPMTNADRRRAIAAATDLVNRLGITSITDPALGPADQRGAMGGGGIDVYREMAAAGELTVRVNALRLLAGLAPELEEFERNFADVRDEPTADPTRFAVVGTKIFADGIPPHRTAWMHDEYVGGGTGSLVIRGTSDDDRVEALRRMVSLAHQRGHQVGVHATGDRAIDTVIDAMIDANAAHPREDARHYVIHADFLSADAIAKCAEHGIGVNMNPAIKWMIADMATEIVGPERSAYEWPYRSALDGGVVVASSSDAPVTLPDWRQGLSTMLLRESRASGTVAGPEQTIGLMDALRTYTINAAWQDRAETWKGSIEVGKVADLCVLGGDLLAIDPHDIPTMPVTMTVLDGEIVYETGDSVEVSAVVGGPVPGGYGAWPRLIRAVCPPADGCPCEYGHLDV
jgi:predicted amidohydrolase YtcJ